MTGKAQKLLLAWFALICAVHVFHSAKSEAQSSSNSLYLVGATEAARLDLHTGAKTVWLLPKQVGLEKEDVCSAGHVPHSCDWSASSTILDLRRKRLYFLAPMTKPGEPLSNEEDIGPFAVWILDTAKMTLLKRVDVSGPESVGTTSDLLQYSMIQSHDGKQVFVGYWPTLIIDVFDTVTFRKTSRIENKGGQPIDTSFSPGSYFLSGEKFIIGGGMNADFRTSVEDGRFRQELVDPRTQLSPYASKTLTEFLKTEVDGRKVLPAIPVSSRNGETLITVANSDSTRAAFWTVDMETGATSPPVVLNYLARAELLDSGEKFAVFQGEFTHKSGSEVRFERTGHVAIYDVTTAGLVHEFTKQDLAGEGTVLCVAQGGSLAAYAHGHEVLSLDLNTGSTKRLATITDLPQPGYLGGCAFE